jgi:molecular chaperone GrpE
MAEEKNIKEKKKTNEKPQGKNIQEEKIVDTQESEDIKEEESEKEKKKPSRKTKKDKQESKIEQLNSKLDEISDKHLRLQAEFDNYRRRTLKEKADLIKTGGESILINLLPVIDDFDRALDSMKEIKDTDPAKQGIILIFNKFKEFLKQNNVNEIDAMNQDFDCDFHEALTKIPAASEELKGKNVDVIQKGYILNEKVIRFAKVVIGE